MKTIVITMNNLDTFSTFALLLIFSIVLVALKTHLPSYALTLSLIISTVLLLYILLNLHPLVLNLRKIIENMNIKNKYLTLIFKILGICTLTQFTSSSLKDAGESSLAFEAELIGKVTIIYTSLPIFLDIINLIVKLTN